MAVPSSWLLGFRIILAACLAQRAAGQCDYSRGTWQPAAVPINRGYPSTCPFISPGRQCAAARVASALKYTFVPPAGCPATITFNPLSFLNRYSNKIVLLAGDSFMTNLVEALACYLNSVAPGRVKEASNSIIVPGVNRRYSGLNVTAPYNVTIIHLPSQFLVNATFKTSGGSGDQWTIDVDRVPAVWTDLLPSVSLFIMSTCHWFYNNPLKNRIFRTNGVLNKALTAPQALEFSTVTVANYLATRYNKEAVYLTCTASHGQGVYSTLTKLKLGTGSSCANSNAPFTPQQLNAVTSKILELPYREAQVKVLRSYPKMTTLDITNMTAYRPDMHTAILSSGTPDCSHFCVPGMPETWLDLMWTQLLSRR